MQEHLSKCNISVEIYTYDEFSKDDIFDKFKERLANMSTSAICKATGLRKNYVAKVKDAIEDEKTGLICDGKDINSIYNNNEARNSIQL